jgi:hypothetical protein
MNFVTPLPPNKVWIRSEYLYDHDPARVGEVVEGVWVSAKSIRGQAFRFETYLPGYGALYDKLPISAFVWKEDYFDLLPLDVLQIWDCLSYHVSLIEKPLLRGLRAEFFGKDRQLHAGEYLFTLDNCHPDPRIPDFGFSETPEEHKSYNVLALDNGQFALQPNNRCRFFDPALTHANLKMPDFKVCTKTYRVENTAKWRLGDTSTVTYDDRSEGSSATSA